MEPHAVVEDFDVFEDGQAGLLAGGKGAPGEQMVAWIKDDEEGMNRFREGR